MIVSPISPIQEKKSPIILYRRPKSLQTSYILTSHLIIFLKKFRNGVKRAKSNKNIYFVKLYFWFGFLLNVFCRSLQNYPIQNCFKCCYVKFSGSEKILYFAEKSIKSPILRMKIILYFHQKLSISPILSKIPFSYISDFGRYHPWHSLSCLSCVFTLVTLAIVTEI